MKATVVLCEIPVNSEWWQSSGSSPQLLQGNKWYHRSRWVSSILTITTMNIETIMSNTYGVLTNKCSVEDILEQYTGEDAMFYGNPYDMTTQDVDEVISFYENTEEYEKCQELLYIKSDIMADGLTKKLIRKCLIEN